MAGMKVEFKKIGNQFGEISNLIGKGNFNKAHNLLNGLIPKIVGLDEKLTRQQVLGIGSASKIKLSSIQIPEMITISPKLSIMRAEITVGLFKQVMEGYAIEGHNADSLKGLLADPKEAGTALTYVNLFDAREFAKRLSVQTGRKFRVQTEAEWEQARNKLSGDYWTWTETKYGSGSYVLRRLGGDVRDFIYPGIRYGSRAVRLVEDK